MNAPDPGEGWRLVTDYNEAPHSEAECWINRWASRLPGWHMRPYKPTVYYRVPSNAPFAPIPLAENPDSFVNNPDRSPAVVIWIIGALVFVTGFLIGWSL